MTRIEIYFYVTIFTRE